MTTGRINQVTILTPPAIRLLARPLNRGRVVSKQGGATRQSPTLRSQEQQLQLVPQDHPIAPTEFPKGWSAIQLIKHQQCCHKV
jgi:hypothetical protein